MSGATVKFDRNEPRARRGDASPHGPFAGTQQFFRHSRAVVSSLMDDGRGTAPESLGLIYCQQTAQGWLVTTPSVENGCHVVLGLIVQDGDSFFVTFQGRPQEPFDLPTFDEALDFFAEYRSALDLGVSPDR